MLNNQIGLLGVKRRRGKSSYILTDCAVNDDIQVKLKFAKLW